MMSPQHLTELEEFVESHLAYEDGCISAFLSVDRNRKKNTDTQLGNEEI